jgi:phosphoribosyl 1,2-cyclic phosphate phosphodiesterase
VPEALELIATLQPAHAYLTHVSHTLEHDKTNQRIGPHVEVAYDGLRLELSAGTT